MRRLAATAALLVMALLGGTTLLATASPASAGAHPGNWWALKHAETQAGKWYCWAGAGPSCYDCSGLAMWAYAQVGKSLPHSTYAMLSSGRIYQIPARDRQQGDLAFYGSGHVELVTQHGTFGALSPGTRIGWHMPNAWWHPTSYWRVR